MQSDVKQHEQLEPLLPRYIAACNNMLPKKTFRHSEVAAMNSVVLTPTCSKSIKPLSMVMQLMLHLTPHKTAFESAESKLSRARQNERNDHVMEVSDCDVVGWSELGKAQNHMCGKCCPTSLARVRSSS